ncbi:UDP-N-acetylmuramyl-tripeptide synthetase [Candidatus Wolfebacteria bacterium]|nr:UDP-N-acetylmuramyl-tripeptide synthetase [Candidatus Wolfebacteria bacterium]
MFSHLKKLIPQSLYRRLQLPYHFALAFLGALLYGFPSKRLTVIGVTGTKGKTTTSYLIYQLLQKSGYKAGLASTVLFAIDCKEWLNETKQTMLGRFALQKLLRDMVRAGCTHAIIETSSEGILQYRHRFIDYDAAVLTNLTPEHLERHGGFDNYRAAKVKLFKKVAKKKGGVGVYNLDDKNVEYFLQPRISRKYGYGIQLLITSYELRMKCRISNTKLSPKGTEFFINDDRFEMPLIGEFNVMNAAAAICAAISQNVPIERIKSALREAKAPPGRFELISNNRGITIIVDYSYETASFEKALQAIRIFNPSRVIAIIGGTGGGRDKWRRPILGELADQYADIAIVTTDDPYDENPEAIIDEILEGAKKRGDRVIGDNLFRIIDRRDAIKKALVLAGRGDAILLAGMGAERSITIAGGKTMPWNDREVVEGELQKL